MYVSCHRHFFLVLLLNQRWSPPLRFQASHCSTFLIMCDVPSIAVFCSKSIECFPGIASKFFPKLLVTIPVAPIITGTIVHFRFHIRCISIHPVLYIIIIIIIIIIMLPLVTGFFSSVPLPLNQWWAPALRLQLSACGTFRIIYDVPSTAVFCSKSIEYIAAMTSQFFCKPLLLLRWLQLLLVRSHISCSPFVLSPHINSSILISFLLPFAWHFCPPVLTHLIVSMFFVFNYYILPISHNFPTLCIIIMIIITCCCCCLFCHAFSSWYLPSWNQLWSSPLMFQFSGCSTSRIMCDSPSIITIITIIIIIIIIIISFMQGIYIYIPDTNYVPREYSVAAILLLLFMVLISLVSVLNLLYFYISTLQSMYSVVPWLHVFLVCSSHVFWITLK